MDNLSILNYQGSKRNLLDFIHKKIDKYMSKDDVILDIFSGTCSVGYSYKKTNLVLANDVEKYSYIISSALLGKKAKKDVYDRNALSNIIKKNKKNYSEFIEKEYDLIFNKDYDDLIRFYKSFETIWNTKKKDFINKNKYQLFLKYYGSNYYGVNQAIEIDSIREYIDLVDDENMKNILLTCLFFAMKECVFAKDGHMAQPLNLEKNKQRLLAQREKNIFCNFENKLNEFSSEEFINPVQGSGAFNFEFRTLLGMKEKMKNVTVIYADPPYTDMQYSRYYHLLNTCVNYEYANPTINNGNYTSGLYLDNRYQSKLSRKTECLTEMSSLINYSYSRNIMLVISFAYPFNIKTQKTDRYVMDINDLISKCEEVYGKRRVEVCYKNYNHSNNRNSEHKKVKEYLIICKRI